MKNVSVLVLLCSAGIFLVKAHKSEITRAMEKYKIIPDVTNQQASELLEVLFEDNVRANMGNELKPYETRNPPSLDWNADKNAFYTLVTIDADAPGEDDPAYALLNTWLVGNIPGKDVHSGETLFEYIPAATAKGLGFSRFTMLIYKQLGKLQFDEQHIDKFHLKGRSNFSLDEFESKYDLDLFAANFFNTSFDYYSLYAFGQVQCCFEFNKF